MRNVRYNYLQKNFIMKVLSKDYKAVEGKRKKLSVGSLMPKFVCLILKIVNASSVVGERNFLLTVIQCFH